MGAVNLHAIHANGLGIAGGLGKGGDDVLDVRVGHAVHDLLAILDLLARPVARHADIGFYADTAYAAHMPQLWHDLAPFGMHGIDHFFPAGQRIFTVEARHIGVAIGSLVADGGALGDDQADTGRSTAAIVFDDLGVRHATRGKRTGHRGHHHAGRQFQGTQLEGLEQRFDRHAGTP
ncbi:hypothetical protein D3C76_487090 [compost metagenome]